MQIFDNFFLMMWTLMFIPCLRRKQHVFFNRFREGNNTFPNFLRRRDCLAPLFITINIFIHWFLYCTPTSCLLSNVNEYIKENSYSFSFVTLFLVLLYLVHEIWSPYNINNYLIKCISIDIHTKSTSNVIEFQLGRFSYF